MNPLGSLRRAPWLSGALSLALAAGLVAPAAYALGLRRWPITVGLIALVLLALGSLERVWQRRPLDRPPRPRKKLRLVSGGKGNGHSDDLENDTSTDKQRWLM